MSINYLPPNLPAGSVSVKQFTGTIDTSSWKTTASNPVLILASAGTMNIPISFTLNVTSIINTGALQSYLIGTNEMILNGDAFMGIGSFLSGSSPADKNYTFYFNANTLGNAIGEVSDNNIIDYDIYLYSTLDDPLLNIKDTPYVISYIEVSF